MTMIFDQTFDQTNDIGIDDRSSVLTLFFMVLVVLVFTGGLFVAMFGLPQIQKNTPSQAKFSTAAREELPALVAVRSIRTVQK